jgi:hypothetical protein
MPTVLGESDGSAPGRMDHEPDKGSALRHSDADGGVMASDAKQRAVRCVGDTGPRSLEARSRP